MNGIHQWGISWCFHAVPAQPLARADFQEVASLKSDYRGFFVPLRFEEWCPGWALVWDAASTGNMTMFNDVVRLLTPQVGASFPSGLSSTVRAWDVRGGWRAILA